MHSFSFASPSEPSGLSRSKPSQGTARRNTLWEHQIQWEACERRLALSAMPWGLWDFTGQAIGQSHHPDTSSASLNNTASPIYPLDNDPSTPTLETHLSEAHAQTGWNQVHTQYGLTGKGQTVAVIDSGIAFDHVALGKGFGPGYKVVGGWDFAEGDARPYDDAPGGFHGTHVAGIIGANDGVHFGVAPDVDLVALRVFDDMGKGQMSWAESALRWVHDNRNTFANPITTVNLSLGATWNSSTIPDWAILEDELAQLKQDGIVVIASAGNAFAKYNAPGLAYPAASPNVIPVASVDGNGMLSDFSQRDSRVIAAPGRAIESTVPDYFYGKDGINNDWATASGTSMAAPYVAGASVLIREAMEMVGMQNIDMKSIYDHLYATANTVWDSITNQSYRSLDLDRAIESILPQDNVGDSFATATATTIQSSWQTDGWINTLSDRDVYRLSPAQSGTISLQVSSDYLEDATYRLIRNGQETSLTASGGRLSFSVSAGEAIGLSIAAQESIGSYRLNWSFEASQAGNGESNSGGHTPSIPSHLVDLGAVDLSDQSLSGASRYRVTAAHSGIMSFVVDADTPLGTLQVLRPNMANGTLTDSTVEGNEWRIDVNVTAGQNLELVLPNASAHQVKIVNLLEQSGTDLKLYGTSQADQVEVDLRSGLHLRVAGVSYQFDATSIRTIALEGGLNNDSLNWIGSSAAEKVSLSPGLSTLENTQLSIQATGFENVQFHGNGGPDRAYLYDADTDDRLNIWPNKAEMTGVGYSFAVDQVERLFVHALRGGADQAFVFDSTGDDVLSVRPQFTSLSGNGFFNYISGFEHVYAYSTGGIDKASLYDSAGDDLFSTSGEVTSIVGPGFSTFARGYEIVEAFSTAGGQDRANIYASAQGQLTAGADYVGMQDGVRSSIARSFERIDTFLAGQSIAPPSYSAASQSDAATFVGLQTANSEISIPAESEASANEVDAAQGAVVYSNEASAPMVASAHTQPSSFLNQETIDPVAAIQDRMDWVHQLVQETIDTYRRPSAFATDADHREMQSTLDLAWLDPSYERAVLDDIFSKL